jgi:hypothetical protein
MDRIRSRYTDTSSQGERKYETTNIRCCAITWSSPPLLFAHSFLHHLIIDFCCASLLTFYPCFLCTRPYTLSIRVCVCVCVCMCLTCGWITQFIPSSSLHHFFALNLITRFFYPPSPACVSMCVCVCVCRLLEIKNGFYLNCFCTTF